MDWVWNAGLKRQGVVVLLQYADPHSSSSVDDVADCSATDRQTEGRRIQGLQLGFPEPSFPLMMLLRFFSSLAA